MKTEDQGKGDDGHQPGGSHNLSKSKADKNVEKDHVKMEKPKKITDEEQKNKLSRCHTTIFCTW